MGAYLFELELPGITEEIIEAIPQHRQQVIKLFAEGKLLSYSVSLNRTMIWCAVQAENEQDAMELVLTFPLFQFFTDVTCHSLLFHNASPTLLPTISLN